MNPEQQMVWDFHTALALPNASRPAVIPEERLRLRGRMALEEVIEHIEGLGAHPDAVSALQAVAEMAVLTIRAERFDMEKAVDGSIDARYILHGTDCELGVNSAPLFAEVHRKNLLKATGERRADGKRLKPPGWTPPDLLSLLIEQGYEPPSAEPVDRIDASPHFAGEALCLSTCREIYAPWGLLCPTADGDIGVATHRLRELMCEPAGPLTAAERQEVTLLYVGRWCDWAASPERMREAAAREAAAEGFLR